MKISVQVIEAENEYIATCPELDINCYGYDKKEAVNRIEKVIQFYIESAKELGLDVDSLHEIKIDGENRETQNPQINMPSEAIN